MDVLGVWMWPESAAREGAGRAAERCARLGVTDLFFLTKGLAGTVSCQSGVAPAGGEDLLGQMLEAAHARGIRVHAWITSAADARYKALHPESGRCHYTRGRDKGLISLRDKGYLDYMERFLGELCARYAIDGLHLDYIRYNHLLYGWEEDSAARYAAEGADPARLRDLVERTFLRGDPNRENAIFDAYRAGDESVRAFARVRREDVTAFARALADRAGRARGGLILSAALMPEGAYEDTAFADLHYGQSYADAAGLFDWSIPMAYSMDYKKNAAWVRRTVEGTLRYGGKKVLAGLQAYGDATGDTLRADAAAAAETGCAGLCLFRFGTFAAAVREGKALAVFNPTDAPLTGLALGEVPLPLAAPVPPGGEARVPLPGAPGPLRAFSGERECCIFLPGGNA